MSPRPSDSDRRATPVKKSKIPQRSLVSPDTASRIPKCSSTPSKATVSRSQVSTFGRVGTIRSSLPRGIACRRPETPVKSPSVLVSKKPSPLANCDKPLPSPPIAQVVDPTSSPRAHRTLVDAESGSPSEKLWPILRPEDASQAKRDLSINVTATQQQPSPTQPSQPCQPCQPIVSNETISYFSTNTPVNNRTIAPSAASSVYAKYSADSPHSENVPIHGAKVTQVSGARRFSSNNPYAKAFHVVSPTANALIDSPLVRKKNRLTPLAIPPRVSSNRTSQPLFGRTQPVLPARSASAQPPESSPRRLEWPLLGSPHEATTHIEPSKSSEQQVVRVGSEAARKDRNKVGVIEPVTQSSKQERVDLPSQSSGRSLGQCTSAALEDLRAQTCESFEAEQEISIFQALVQPHNDSSLSLPSGSLVDPRKWIYERGSKFFSKKLSWHEDQPINGPMLRIHRDAEAILLGNGSVPPESPEQVDEPLGRKSLSKSFGMLAGRKSRQQISTAYAGTSTQTPELTLSDIETQSPVVASPIKPIRSMKPARQFSSGISPRSASFRAGPSPQTTRTSQQPAQRLIMECPVAEIFTTPTVAPPVEPGSIDMAKLRVAKLHRANIQGVNCDELNADQSGADEDLEEEASATTDYVTPAKKAKKILGLRKTTPPKGHKPCVVPSWEYPTLSSSKMKRQARNDPSQGLHRMSSRESSSILRCPASRAGPSELTASNNVTPTGLQASADKTISRGTQTPSGWVRPSSTSSPQIEDATEQLPVELGYQAKNHASLKLKARRSLHNLFVKSEAKPAFTSKLPQPVRKSGEPRRTSIASSGKTLVKRLSRNFSKVHLLKKTPDIPKFEMQNLEALKKRDAALAALKATSPVEATSAVEVVTSVKATSATDAPESPTVLHLETASTVSHLVHGITKVTVPSPTSMRRLDLADAYVHAAGLLKQTQINATQSRIDEEMRRKHARNAQLLAERVRLELARIDFLADFDFEDDDINKTVKKLLELRKRMEDAANAAAGFGDEMKK